MTPQVSSGMSDKQVLYAMVELGSDYVRACQERQAGLGKIQDDPRWTLSLLPLRFESQLQLLLLGALDAYDAVAGVLRTRASQQVFNLIRFQTETLALIRWMVEYKDPRERQWRAYRVLCGQLARQSRMLAADAAKGPAGAETTANRAKAAARRLQELIAEDGYPRPKHAPGRPHLFKSYLEEGYEAFGMYSELGSHPGGAGHILFALADEETGEVTIDLGEAFALRAFWVGVSLFFLHKTIVEVGLALRWDDWVKDSLPPLVRRMETLLDEAVKRKRSQRES